MMDAMNSTLARANKPDILDWYSQCYERLRALCARPARMRDETVLRVAEIAALYASAHHPGRLFDGTLENIAFEIGQRLDSTVDRHADSFLEQRPPAKPRSGRRRVLHVSPLVWNIGGHTRTLRNWIALDSESEHYLILTDRVDPTLATEVRNDLESSGGEFIVLPKEMGLVGKAKVLRAFAQSTADVIVLHHGCNDVVPVAAFATPNLPPVLFVNDCDQAFWLGGSITDVIVNQREAGARWSRERRAAPGNAVLPIPLSEPSKSSTREDARRNLGLPLDASVLLTVGRAIKYRSTGSHDFFATARRILDRVPNAHLLVVGLSEEDARQWKLNWKHPRIQLCGPNPDPSLHRAAADLYLESMPFGSATALLEAVLAGLPVVLPYAPTFELLVTNHGLEHIVGNAATEDEYIHRIVTLLNDETERMSLGRALESHVRAKHTGPGWFSEVTAIYRSVEGARHEPRPIPPMECSSGLLDRSVSEWQAFLNGDGERSAVDFKKVRELALATPFGALKRGDLAGAFELFRRCIAVFGFNRELVETVVGVPSRKVFE